MTASTGPSLREMFNRRRSPRDCKLDFAPEAHRLGEDVARLHVALAEAFGAEPADGGAWADDMSAFLSGDRARWQWTMMIMQPAFVDTATLAAAIAQVRDDRISGMVGLFGLAESGDDRRLVRAGHAY